MIAGSHVPLPTRFAPAVLVGYLDCIVSMSV